MGCSQSKIENEEAVSRCKDRKHLMKSAVSSRNAFAAAHSSYSISLKHTGAALSDFSSGESLSSSSSPPPPPLHSLPTPIPPPPPPDSDLAPPPLPLQRAASMPEFALSSASSSAAADKPQTIEEDNEEEEEEDETENLRRRRNRVEAPPPVPEVERRTGTPPPPPVNDVAGPSWEYFFDMENMPRGSLGDEEELRREAEREAENERARRAVAAAAKAKAAAAEAKAAEERNAAVEKPPLPPPSQVVKKGKQVAGPGSGGGEVKMRSVSLVQVFNDLDNCFLAASESAQDVSKLLEAARLHYHSNFADNRGHIDHSARLMRVITWNRSFRGLPNAEEYKDEFDSEENETHATVLDKLLAWEKKLYDEVKAGEIMKFEYQRKVALLNKQKKRGASSESLEKIKATVSHLHTRYIVDMQSMDSTVSEINRLRDEQLYPRLVTLVDAMVTMWDAMQGYHENQLNISATLRAVDISQSAKETTDHHHDRTIQLWGVVQEWHMQFEKMVDHQKEYIRALNSWLKLNLIPIESSLKEKVSSPPRAQNPPIQGLLLAWHDLLEKLPDEHAKSAIHNFGSVLHTIVVQQEDELKLRAKVEESIRDLEKKERQYNKWLKEYTQSQRRTASDEMEPPPDDDGFSKDEIMVQKEFVVENAKKKLEDDRENYARQCLHVREKSLTSLKTRLPELFRALSDYARSSSDMYRNLKAIPDSQPHIRREMGA